MTLSTHLDSPEVLSKGDIMWEAFFSWPGEKTKKWYKDIYNYFNL